MSRPVRTCTGCRKRGDKHELLRVVARDGAVEPDPRQVLPGRGAYLHPAVECLDKALRRRAIGRALRTTVDAGQVEAALRVQIGRRA
ncbi:YlxR family protein [Microlunatus ginsengisoli]|uniref:YlxR domain-containing protein n=1 Tax=Microlunatus ginsengisoli TaxID=363863 RepID=A0ABP7A708_9ACTN